MKLYYSALFLIVFLASSCSIKRYTKLGYYQELVGVDYQKYISDSIANIIDVRTKKKYKKTHIIGAQNASYTGGDFSETVDSTKMDASLSTLIYCETQHRSLFATKKLITLGFKNIVDLDKGMIAWRKNGFPYF